MGLHKGQTNNGSFKKGQKARGRPFKKGDKIRLGSKHTPEAIEKIKKNRKGKNIGNTHGFVKGQPSWNLGKPSPWTSERNLTNNPAKKGIESHFYIDGRHSITNYNIKFRLSIIEILGFKCCKCGFDDIRALQVDHINGGGYQEIKNLSAKQRYKLVLEFVEKKKVKYQLLCPNCNWIKRFEDKEVLGAPKKYI